MEKYIYPRDGLPELEYDDPQKEESCGTCINSIVTNPGANIPGLACCVMTDLFKKKNIENGMDQVSKSYGSCKFYDMTPKAILQALRGK